MRRPQQQQQTENAGLAELEKFVTNLGVAECAPSTLMKRYLESTSDVYPFKGTAYARVAAENASFLFSAEKTSPGLFTTYAGRQRPASVWRDLFPVGTAFGRNALDTHLYGQFADEVLAQSGVAVCMEAEGGQGRKWLDYGITGRITPAQEVALFHLLCQPNISAVVTDPAFSLSCGKKETVALAENLSKLSKHLKSTGHLVSNEITADVRTMIEDCEYGLIQGKGWRNIVPPPPPSVPISSAIRSGSRIGATVQKQQQHQQKAWDYAAERQFADNPNLRAYKQAIGLPVYHPSRDTIHSYLSDLTAGAKGDEDAATEHVDHGAFVGQVLPFCNVGEALMETPEMQTYVDAMYQAAGVTQAQFDAQPKGQLIKGLLMAYGKESPTEAEQAYLDQHPNLSREFISTLLPLS